jgi:DNA repair photolyase
MKPKLVIIPTTKTLIKASPGFAKKRLSEFKLDLAGLCGFGCQYCSSNNGNYLRIHREEFADLTQEQLGHRYLPADEPSLMFMFDDVIGALTRELSSKPKSWGKGQTIVVSMLTDAFSPLLVKQGITRAALEPLLERTSFRIRILTKNAIVGNDQWIEFFKAHPGRFVVGLSIGSLDNAWAERIEIGTSVPTARLQALQRLQVAGIPTYGMLCPIFPDVLDGHRLDELIDGINPSVCECVWSEVFNDRANWRAVRQGYSPESAGWARMTQLFENRSNRSWSAYATQLYIRLRQRAGAEGWLDKLCYLLYEELITESDAREFAGLQGVLLQSKPAKDGVSQHPVFRAMQLAKLRRSA